MPFFDIFRTTAAVGRLRGSIAMSLKLFKETAGVLRDEADVWKSPKLWLAAIALAVVPLINCVIFTGSVWNPYGHLDRLQVALVNSDEGAVAAGGQYRLGDLLAEKLVTERPLGFTLYPYEEWARADLDAGKVRAVFILPKDFSAMALAGSGGKTGKIKLIVSEGQSAFTSKMAESAAAAMSASMNVLIQEKRWAAVGALGPKVGSALGDIKGAVGTIRNGAHSLAEGEDGAADGARRLEAGLAQARTGAEALAIGSSRLNEGAGRLAAGSASARDGAAALAAGTATLAASVAANKLAPKELKTGSKQLAEGGSQVSEGVSSVADGAGALSAGAAELSSNAAKLPEGLTSLENGAGQLVQGNDALAAGSHSLADGLDTLYGKIPAEFSIPLGDPASMSRSVVVAEEKTDAIPNNGNNFAPYFMTINLWIGVLFTTFILPFRNLRRKRAATSQAAKSIGKLIPPIALVGCQALIMVTGMGAFGVRFLHPAAAFGTALLSSIVFLCLVFSLILIFADAGRLLAVILTILQAASAGGTFPVEFAAPFYRVCNAFVPMRFCLDGLRYAVSGAYPADFAANILKLGLVACFSAILMAIGRRKWLIVEEGPLASLVSL